MLAGGFEFWRCANGLNQAIIPRLKASPGSLAGNNRIFGVMHERENGAS